MSDLVGNPVWKDRVTEMQVEDPGHPVTFNPTRQDIINALVYLMRNKAGAAVLRALLSPGVLDLAGGEFLITPQVPATMAVNVAAGPTGAHVDGTVPVLLLDQSVEIAAADPANPRIDTVQLGWSQTTDTAVVEVKAGVPAVAPVAPVPDAGFIALAEVRVDAGAGNIQAANITDRRTQVELLLQAQKADTVDGYHFRVNGTVPEYSVDGGTTWQAFVSSTTGQAQATAKEQVINLLSFTASYQTAASFTYQGLGRWLVFKIDTAQYPAGTQWYLEMMADREGSVAIFRYDEAATNLTTGAAIGSVSNSAGYVYPPVLIRGNAFSMPPGISHLTVAFNYSNSAAALRLYGVRLIARLP